jgi:hypothetical protein
MHYCIVIHIGYYTVARRYGFYVRVARTISICYTAVHIITSLTRDTSFMLDLVHIVGLLPILTSASSTSLDKMAYG